MSIKCFYHSADFDGICSAAIVKRKYPEADLYPIDYGQDFPWGDIRHDDTVIMVDFCLSPFDRMIKLQKLCEEFIWIDHHETALNHKKDRSFSGVQVRDFMAACELTWEYFFPSEPIPTAVKYLGRYDVWDTGDIAYMHYQYGIRSGYLIRNPTSVLWRYLLDETDMGKGMNRKFLEIGRYIYDYVRVEAERYAARYAISVKFLHYNAITLNRGNVNSTVFNSVYNSDRHHLMIAYCKLPSRLWSVSLYTTHDHVHCGEIASRYGGGGHKGAAGFQCRDLPVKV